MSEKTCEHFQSFIPSTWAWGQLSNDPRISLKELVMSCWFSIKVTTCFDRHCLLLQGTRSFLAVFRMFWPLIVFADHSCSGSTEGFKSSGSQRAPGKTGKSENHPLDTICLDITYAVRYFIYYNHINLYCILYTMCTVLYIVYMTFKIRNILMCSLLSRWRCCEERNSFFLMSKCWDLELPSCSFPFENAQLERCWWRRCPGTRRWRRTWNRIFTWRISVFCIFFFVFSWFCDFV